MDKAKQKQSGMVLTKTAEDEYPLGWPDVSRVLLASLLGGFALRGGVGLTKLLGRRMQSPLPPRPEEEEGREREQGPLALPAPKYAEDMSKEAGGLHPAAASAMLLAAGLGGGYGGWTLADKMFEGRRRKELETEITRKKKEYEDLLLGKPQVELRVPKVAACIEHYADQYEGLDPTPMPEPEPPEAVKQAKLDFWEAAPYMAYLTLAALVANEAAGSYRSAVGSSDMERKLKAFKGRPRVRSAPVRARLSQPRTGRRDALSSATKLPELTQSRLTQEEREEDPARGR